MTQEKLTFTGESGDELVGRLDIPDDSEPRGYVLFAHCFTGSKDVLAGVRIAKALWLRGFAVFRFDFTGLGESEGEFYHDAFLGWIQLVGKCCPTSGVGSLSSQTLP